MDDIPPEVMYRAQVAQEIRVLMTRRGITAVDLAERLGHSREWVNRRRNAHTPPTVEDLYCISRTLGVQPAELLPQVDLATTTTEGTT